MHAFRPTCALKARVLSNGLAVVATLGGTSTVWGESTHMPAFEYDRTDVSVWTTSAQDRTIGWEFVAQETLTVTAIGVFDRAHPSPEPGLATPKQVAIWDLGQQMLVSGTVDAGESGSLCLDDYRYIEIEPTVLQAGTSYVVAAFWPGSPIDHMPQFASSGLEPDYHSVTFVQTRIAPSQFEFPGDVVANNGGVGPVNFRIEEGECNEGVQPDLVTTFASDNEFAGNMFDLTATHPDGLTVQGWHINISDPDPVSTPVNVSIWWRQGSWMEADDTLESWNLLGLAAVTPRGPNRGTYVPIGGLELPFDQTIGVYVFLTDYTDFDPPPTVPAMLYSNVPPASSTYSDANLLITGGAGKGVPPFTGDTYPNRMWNGGVVYIANLSADVDGDGQVSVSDLVEVILSFGPCDGDCPADVTGDGVVNVEDVVAVLLSWTG